MENEQTIVGYSNTNSEEEVMDLAKDDESEAWALVSLFLGHIDEVHVPSSLDSNGKADTGEGVEPPLHHRSRSPAPSAIAEGNISSMASASRQEIHLDEEQIPSMSLPGHAATSAPKRKRYAERKAHEADKRQGNTPYIRNQGQKDPKRRALVEVGW